MIGDDDVPAALLQRGAHGVGRLDAFVGNVVAPASQLSLQQQAVVFGIFNNQDAQGDAHVSSAGWVAAGSAPANTIQVGARPR